MQPTYRLKNVLTGVSHSLVRASSVIGRNLHCEIKIDSVALSRNHASLHLTEHGVVIEDLNSTNGTFVNNIRIDSPTLLTDGDVITIGNHRLVLVEPTIAPSINSEYRGLAEDLAYFELDDRTSNNTMIQSSFAKSMGVMPDTFNEIDDEDSLEALILKALRSKPFDPKRVPAVLIIKNSRRRGGLIELKHPVGSDREWAIGRSKLADVVLDDPTISSLHAVISANSKGWNLSDNDSTNGVKVNGVSLDGGEAPCKHGDIVTIGAIELIFYILQI